MEKKLQNRIFDKKHYHFGGIVINSDFNDGYMKIKIRTNGSPIAKRIEEEFRWEERIIAGMQI